MLGLAILFFLVIFLGLWLVITGAVMHVGYKKFGAAGAVAGFMLTMGGFIVYWVVEYIQIQRAVTQLCETEGGITVYVTPEEWKKQIGEEEWATLSEDWKYIDDDFNFSFNDKKYYGYTQLNRRIVSYKARDYINNTILDMDLIYVDKTSNKLLFRMRYFAVGVPDILNSIEGVKFWINSIDDCYVGKWSYKDRFFSDEYINR